MKAWLSKIYYPLQYLLLTVLIVNSSYLSYKYMKFYYWGGMLEAFNCTDGCDSVMMSKYALLWQVPVPVWGLGFFVLLALAFVLLGRGQFGIWLEHLYPYVLLLACLGAISFLYVLYAILHMHCQFCLISHITLFCFTSVFFAKKLAQIIE